ncbi:threonine synthase [Romboutsia sp. 1001713B170207_170306_H8]|uniref:threonine synthase n=1 Tax=Romboutsia sp. 1001713B170207_170306_H8 TaxID=2787112 RepID=UPI00189C473F|nr:threonine synthase [Romboutsia sp. 1001713B170207_170306_H8]
MNYISTRSNTETLSASQAIIKGLSDDGGLYVPSKFPDLREELKNLSTLTYCELAFFILKNFLTDFTDEELSNCINSAYKNNFDTSEITPIKQIGNDYILELFHGPTLAFKDIALTLMPHLLKTSINKNNLDKEILVLTATSGDTGKAALEGFKDIDNVKIIVFFPENGVSPIQKLQMKTQEGKNVFVAGINGNFDDAQSAVKKIFSNDDFNKILNKNGFILSSANSINIGRLLPQVVYYFYSYFKLVNTKKIKLFDKVNFVVPTGNFGDILAGYYAKEMGLPVNKLICASNENNVLYDFFRTGEYNKNKELKLTTSPSMDILVSSNLERLLFESCNRDSRLISALFKSFSETGYYKISNLMRQNLNDFCGYYCTDEEVSETINHVFNKYNYLIDTHTSVAYCSLNKFKSNNSNKYKNIILSTASPFKFAKDVLNSINNNNLQDFDVIDKLSILGKIDVPKPIADLRDKKIIHDNIYDKNELKLAIQNFLEI